MYAVHVCYKMIDQNHVKVFMIMTQNVDAVLSLIIASCSYTARVHIHTMYNYQ